VPRPKASAWKPVGIADNPIPGLYPDGKLDGLIQKHLRVTGQGPRERARKQLRKVLGVLWFGLHYRGRPTGGSKLAALKGKAEPLRQFHDALCGLDADSRRLLEAQAAKDESFDELFPPEDWPYDDGEKVFRDNMGDARYAFALDVLSALANSIEKARASIQPSNPGRRGDDERIAVNALWKIMREARRARTDPSEKELLAFVTDMLAPLRSTGLLKGSMGGHIHQALTSKTD
jgi:hypothetical protein